MISVFSSREESSKYLGPNWRTCIFTAIQKTAVELFDGLGCHFHDLVISNFTGADSIGLKVSGREHNRFVQLEIHADLAIFIGNNTN